MAMAFSKQTRKKMEDLIFNFFSKLDPSGKNTKKYKDFFGAMSDSQFQSFFNKFFQDKSAYLTLDIVTYEHDLSMKNIEDAANLKEVNSKLIEQAGDAYIVPLNTDDDVLKRAIKKVLAAKKVAVKPSKDCKDKYGITNMKSNLSNDKAHMSITYFLKWVQVLNLDAHLIIRFENSDEEVEIIDEELK